MSWRNAVVWSQGMFLQPHHFQQEARYVARMVDARAQTLSVEDFVRIANYRSTRADA